MEERTKERSFSKSGEGFISGETDESEALSGNVTEGQAERSAWDVFAASGKVRDYLLYKGAAEDRAF